jgi:hypothetical protein
MGVGRIIGRPLPLTSTLPFVLYYYWVEMSNNNDNNNNTTKTQ